MSLLHALCVFLGGGCGACLRWSAGLASNAIPLPFNPGNLAVNTAGCFIAGLTWALFSKTAAPETLRLTLVVGFLGGFTTFSAFSVETASLLTTRPLAAIAYALLTVTTCLAATCSGYWLYQHLFE